MFILKDVHIIIDRFPVYSTNWQNMINLVEAVLSTRNLKFLSLKYQLQSMIFMQMRVYINILKYSSRFLRIRSLGLCKNSACIKIKFVCDAEYKAITTV